MSDFEVEYLFERTKPLLQGPLSIASSSEDWRPHACRTSMKSANLLTWKRWCECWNITWLFEHAIIKQVKHQFSSLNSWQHQGTKLHFSEDSNVSVIIANKTSFSSISCHKSYFWSLKYVEGTLTPSKFGGWGHTCRSIFVHIWANLSKK